MELQLRIFCAVIKTE